MRENELILKQKSQKRKEFLLFQKTFLSTTLKLNKGYLKVLYNAKLYQWAFHNLPYQNLLSIFFLNWIHWPIFYLLKFDNLWNIWKILVHLAIQKQMLTCLLNLNLLKIITNAIRILNTGKLRLFMVVHKNVQ